jgi:enolase
VLQAVANVETVIAPELEGMDASNQRLLDQTMIALDGTPNKAKLGANAILAVSMAAARAVAQTLEIPLYRYLGGVNASILPTPMLNVLNGGAHADSQRGLSGVHDHAGGRGALLRGAALGRRDLPHAQGRAQEEGLQHGGGRRGRLCSLAQVQRRGHRTDPRSHRAAGYKPGEQIAIALDPASSEFYDKETGKYVFKKSDKRELTERRDGEASTTTGPASIPSSRSKTAWPRTTGRAGRSSPTSWAAAFSWWATTSSSPTSSVAARH